MGAGYYGGFGNTIGAQDRYRIGKPIPYTEKDLAMALNRDYYVAVICKKYNIHLKSGKVEIKIVINPNLEPAGRVVKTRPNIIELGPKALINESELANTIAHELNHSRSFLKGGNAPENTAYQSGDALEDYIKGNR